VSHAPAGHEKGHTCVLHLPTVHQDLSLIGVSALQRVVTEQALSSRTIFQTTTALMQLILNLGIPAAPAFVELVLHSAS
jgi:hypothetical protein